VENPLLGPRGAARVFGPQKGASPEEVELLEDGLARLAGLSPRPALRRRPGAGAAGGLAFGCGAFLGASIVPGAPWVLERVGFADRLARADLVLTGEGAFDATTGMGKIVDRVLRRAREEGVAAGLVCGRLEADLPPGVRAADGGGQLLEAAGIEELASALVRDGGAPAG
jgi:glycerate kinase